ncbi:hypothetical protein BO94DRAFT_503581 [Aspergillus sclerotioniger CBS 115572]|uniref:Zn(2)-C6 fungal-type domain-containing protein n=1 Tax=Aspergillus sclerotioniger CBS 115572 TaxID=1450535 RepID=A0A317V1N9_9EURO|nr:hypothetical protein BO94DRAFT_503581 [Aspergillus sclerotioniger CBS 115572]PWY67985.1 hypothetical protein BO94DRAFT_503581 [Aspergillus sclerotioniger CBS 115572]
MPDLACTRCRERKIRCGRERPRCRNCEREGGVSCIYRIPAKRVNHLKLLCDSIERLQDRLTTIESHLSRLHGTGPGLRTPTFEEDQETTVSCGLGGLSASSANDSDMEDEDNKEGATPDYSFGPASVSGLCDQLRKRILSATEETEAEWRPLCDMLQHLSDMAGRTEPFPSYSDRIHVPLLPKQQVVTAIDRFFQLQDCQTDVFVPDNVLANLDRVYAQQQPEDDAWRICFQTITLLVLGTGNSQSALFGDFARSFLPTRAALVSSRLLSTPRLVNVQALLLLSVAAQRLDPPGWAELIFAHACMLARFMDLQHSPVAPDGDVQIERAKVLRALYVRDRSLCALRGSVLWLPIDDSNIAAHLRVSLDHDKYSDRLHLALIQEDIYQLCQWSTSSIQSHSRGSLMRTIEEQLEYYARTLDLQQCFAASSCGPQVVIALEFLSTRIMALQHGRELRHAEQVRLDSRTSCLLLLKAYGDQDPAVVYSLNALISGRSATERTSHQGYSSHIIPFASVLDVFSVPAFFVLLQDLLLARSGEAPVGVMADLDMLRRVSICYSEHASRAQANNYHRKVAWVFSQLLGLLDVVPDVQPKRSLPESPKAHDFPSPLYWPAGPSASLTWESWLAGASSMGLSPLAPGTPLGTWNLVGAQAPDGEVMPWPGTEGSVGQTCLQHE